MENLLFLSVPILKNIRVIKMCIWSFGEKEINVDPLYSVIFGQRSCAIDYRVWSLSTVKILKIGTPIIITIIVLQLEQLDFTVQ